MARSSGPFIVVYGDEDFLLDRFITNRRAAWKNRSVALRDGAYIEEQALITLCETQTMFDDGGRAVILDNAQDLKPWESKRASEKKGKKKEGGDFRFLKEYVEGRDLKDTSCILVAVVRSKTLPEIWNEVSKKGAQIVYPKFRPWETQKVLDRISEEAKSLKLKLEDGVPEMIFHYLGDELRTTVNELRKLTYLVGEDSVVTKKHVGLVLAPNTPVEPYQVADSAIAKNAKQAMARMANVYKALGDGACVAVTSNLLKKVEQTLVVRQMLDKGDSSKIIALRCKVHEFVCQKTLIPTAQKHTVSALLGHMNQLCKLDAQVKGAARSKRTLVELALLSIAA